MDNVLAVKIDTSRHKFDIKGMFNRRFMCGETLIRGFPGKWEQSMRNIIIPEKKHKKRRKYVV
jgi:hypothetical protein